MRNYLPLEIPLTSNARQTSNKLNVDLALLTNNFSLHKTMLSVILVIKRSALVEGREADKSRKYGKLVST